jgi:hypothetical protein
VHYPVAILGSCVSRDTASFSAEMEVQLYCARQSIASIVTSRVSNDLFDKLVLDKNISSFHQRCIEEDLTKSTLIKIARLPEGMPVLIDLIEERVPLGRTACGSIVTLSETAALFSNLETLVTETIKPWSGKHLKLFAKALPRLATALEHRPVLIHRAFYAEDQRMFPRINDTLAHMYDLLSSALPNARQIEVAAELRKGEVHHKWGPGPYHYIDAYYKAALAEAGRKLQLSLSCRPDFSLRVEEGSHT